MRSSKIKILNFDWKLVLMYLLLILVGWLSIYTTSKSDTHNQIFDFSVQYGKQLIWIFLSFLLIVVLVFLDTRFYIQFSSLIYLFSVLLLAGLFVFGKTVNGANSWYVFGSFSIQPSEFAKIGVALGIAKLLGDKQFDLKNGINQLKGLLLISIPMLLIILQPDQGSALVFLSFLFVFYREGLPKYYIVVGFLTLIISVFIIKYGYIYLELIAFLIFISFLIYLYKKHTYIFRQFWFKYILIYLFSSVFIFGVHYIYHNNLPQRHKDRIDLTLNIIKDKKGKGYNTRQSLIAIGSGGFFGQGYLNGSQTHGKFVPEQHTDYIFSAIAEEWGFLGSAFVVILYVLFILQIITVAEKQKAKFSRIYGYSIASIFFIHFAINIGMVIDVLPTIGIPLPFMSYGGSSLWAFTILLFIFIRLDANKGNEW